MTENSTETEMIAGSDSFTNGKLELRYTIFVTLPTVLAATSYKSNFYIL